jgi:SAM-dependent methyltransferase
MNAKARHELRKRSFDANPRQYWESRPHYPEELIDDLVCLSGIPPHGRVLEIGPGPGEATLPMARRGFRILGLELSPRMARLCRKNLAQFPDVAVRATSFEDWPLERAAFDLVLAASSFHWLKPGPGFAKSAAALKPNGYIALVWNFRESPDDELHRDLFGLYRALGLRDQRAREPEERTERQRKAIERSGRFGPVTIWRYPVKQPYTATEYINLMRTMSDHAIMEPATRRWLFAGIRQVFRRHGGTYVRPVVATLLLAPKHRG